MSGDRWIRYWDSFGRKLSELQVDDKPQVAALSVDEEKLAIGCYHGEIIVYNTVANAINTKIVNQNGNVTALAFSPDSAILATAGWVSPLASDESHPILLWDVKSMKQLNVLPGFHFSERVNGITFLDSNRYLIATGYYSGSIHMIDCQAQRIVGTVKCEPYLVSCYYWSECSCLACSFFGRNNITIVGIDTDK